MEVDNVKDRELPLAGVVLCFTSILPEQRSELAEIAGQMGAIHQFDLTSDVTHLLVGETNTEKYKFVARERSDVLVLMPEWIEAVRRQWMDGGDTDLHALEQGYKLPTFHGLSICVTGFEDASYRNYLQETAIANGADFRKDLTKTVTHLIAQQPSGQKYKFAKQWQVKVVSAKWFIDSLERGMILDEARYDPLLPPHEQGVGAWNRVQAPVSNKRKTTSKSSNNGSRKLRKVASAKLGDQNEGIWGDIIGGGFASSHSGRSVSRNKLTSADLQGNEGPNEIKPTLQSELLADHPIAEPSEEHSLQQQGFLHGRYFYIHGFSHKQVAVLRHHLTANGGIVVDHLNEFSSHSIPKDGNCLYIISSYKTPQSEVPSTEDKGFSCETVTDMWLERCLDANAFVEPETHVTSTPFSQVPMKDFAGLKICSTGFAGIDLLHMSKMVNVMGAQYSEYLTVDVSVLICRDQYPASTEKVRHALEWKIPIVSADWLWISVQAGKRKNFDPYLIRQSASQKAETNTAIPRYERHDSPKANESDLSPPETNDIQNPRANAVNDHEARPSTASEIDRSTKEGRDRSGKESLSDTPLQTTDPHNKGSNQQLTESVSNNSSSDEPRANKSTENLESSMNRFLKKARELTRSQSLLGKDKAVQRRRPILGRTNSLSSKKDFKRSDSHVSVSSIDTLNEDGYGSAVSADTEVTNSLATRLSRNLTGQSLSSLLSSSKLTRYIDSPIPENEELRDDDNSTPAMTQLNYDDPNAMAAREEIMRLAQRGKVDEAHVSRILKQKDVRQPQAVVDEFPQMIDKHTTARRTRRSAGKQQEEAIL